MPIIQHGMCIQCRTEEEFEVFLEVAKAEGHGSIYHNSLNEYRNYPYRAFNVGYAGTEYPKDILNTRLDVIGTGMTKVEASQLFRNQLISRRAKHDSSTE